MATPLVRFCSLPDSLTTEEIGARWTKGKVLWTPTAELPGLSPDEWLAALAEAWANWMAVCGIIGEYTDTGRLADVIHGVGAIDGSGKTLAWSELPNGSNSRLQQKYDSGEMWIRSANPPQSKIDIVAVATHELGHAIGMGHDTGTGQALMDPYYKPGLRTPQPRDIARAVALYGKPQPAPLPPTIPPIPLPSDETIVIQITGAEKIVIPGYRIVKE